MSKEKKNEIELPDFSHTALKTTDISPPSTPDGVEGISSSSNRVLLPPLVLSDQSPSKNSYSVSPSGEPSPVFMPRNSPSPSRRLSFSREMGGSPKSTPGFFSRPNTPAFLSRPHSTTSAEEDTSQSLVDLLAKMTPGWSMEKERFTNQAMNRPSHEMKNVSVLDTLKIQRNKDNIKRFIQDQLHRAKAALVFLDFQQQKEKTQSSLLSEQEVTDYPKVLLECLVSASLAENLVKGQMVVSFYRQNQPTLTKYLSGGQLEFLDQRLRESFLVKNQPTLLDPLHEKTEVEFKHTLDPYNAQLRASWESSAISSDHKGGASDPQENSVAATITPPEPSSSSTLVNLSAMCAREKAQSAPVPTPVRVTLETPDLKTQKACCCLIS
jgi:hypothetical protein